MSRVVLFTRRSGYTWTCCRAGGPTTPGTRSSATTARGRIAVRASGTEPGTRLYIEAPAPWPNASPRPWGPSFNPSA